MRSRVLIVFVFFSAQQALAQGSATATAGIPVQFCQFFRGYSIINPAMNGVNGADVELELGKQRSTGTWRHISTSYASVFCKVKPSNKRSSNFHVPGLSFISDKPGQFLSHSKAYVTYAWHTRLNKKLSLSGGSAVGFYTYRVEPGNSGGGSDSKPDASFGITLYNPRFFLAASLNQIFAFELQPISYPSEFERHANLSFGVTYEVSKEFIVTPIALVRVAPNVEVDGGDLIEVDVAGIGTLNRSVVIGFSYRHHRNLMTMFGLENLNVGTGNLKAGFSYSLPLGRIANNIHTYELTLNYKYSKPKKKSTK